MLHENISGRHGSKNPALLGLRGALLGLLVSLTLSACGDGESGTSDDATVNSTTSSSSSSSSGTTSSSSSSSSSTTSSSSSSSSSTTSSSTTTSSTSAKASTASTSTASTSTVTNGKSISQWATCDGKTDDSVKAAEAFAAAANSAFTLVVDCPVYIHIGMDIARPIFINNDTTVVFEGSGKFIVDNVLVPAFVIANTKNVTLTDWNVEYTGGVPVNDTTGGFYDDGKWVTSSGNSPPSSVFNDVRLTEWLSTNRGISFAKGSSSIWAGPTNTSSVFFLLGDTDNVQVTGLDIYVPSTVGVNKYIPMVFSMTQGWKSDESVSSATPNTAEYRAIPHDLDFENITLDGTYMGWQGNLQSATFSNIKSERYGDLQDANGNYAGGVNYWFSPPHLFYLSAAVETDTNLYNKDITISNVSDVGPRLGVARNEGGNALSLKIGCVSCSVSSYSTCRKDGFLDLLASDGLTIDNATASYDSSFLNNLYPGWRFPSTAGSTNVTVKNVTLTDTASATYDMPIGNSTQSGNSNIVLSNITVQLKKWAGSYSIPPAINGTGNSVSIEYKMSTTNTLLHYSVQSGATLSVQAQPASVSVGGTSLLSFAAHNASQCTGSGGWTGTLGTGGSRNYKATKSGSISFSVSCESLTRESTSSTTSGSTVDGSVALNVL